MKKDDLVILSLSEIPLKRNIESLPQLKEYVKQNYSKQGLFCLALVQLSASPDQPIFFRIAESQHSFLQTLQGRSPVINLHAYQIRMNLTKDTAMLSALERVSRNQIFSKFLSPRKFKARYNLDQLDNLQGLMEKYQKEAEKAHKLIHTQGVALSAYLAYFKENLLLINGKVV